jgi:hypothetical protein
LVVPSSVRGFKAKRTNKLPLISNPHLSSAFRYHHRLQECQKSKLSIHRYIPS